MADHPEDNDPFEEDIVFDEAGLLGGKMPRARRQATAGFLPTFMLFIRTVFLCIAFLGLGLCVSASGGPLIQLERKAGVPESTAFHVFTARSIGMLVGGGLGSVLFEIYNRQFLLSVSLVWVAAAVTVLPFTVPAALWWTLASTAALGVGLAFLFTGGNVLCLDLWGRQQGGAALQTLHFSFSLGALVVPLVVQPFFSGLQPATISPVPVVTEITPPVRVIRSATFQGTHTPHYLTTPRMLTDEQLLRLTLPKNTSETSSALPSVLNHTTSLPTTMQPQSSTAKQPKKKPEKADSSNLEPDEKVIKWTKTKSNAAQPSPALPQTKPPSPSPPPTEHQTDTTVPSTTSGPQDTSGNGTATHTTTATSTTSFNTSESNNTTAANINTTTTTNLNNTSILSSSNHTDPTTVATTTAPTTTSASTTTTTIPTTATTTHPTTTTTKPTTTTTTTTTKPPIVTSPPTTTTVKPKPTTTTTTTTTTTATTSKPHTTTTTFSTTHSSLSTPMGMSHGGEVMHLTSEVQGYKVQNVRERLLDDESTVGTPSLKPGTFSNATEDGSKLLEHMARRLVDYGVTRVDLTYISIGILVVVDALVSVVVLCHHPREARSRQEGGSMASARPSRILLFMVLFSAFMFTAEALQGALHHLLATTGENGGLPLAWGGSDEGPNGQVLFWGLVCLVRFLCIPAAGCLGPPGRLLGAAVVFSVAGSTFMVVGSSGRQDFVWAGVVFLAVGCAPVLPTSLLWMAHHMRVTHRLCALMVVIASFGNTLTHSLLAEVMGHPPIHAFVLLGLAMASLVLLSASVCALHVGQNSPNHGAPVGYQLASQHEEDNLELTPSASVVFTPADAASREGGEAGQALLID